MKLHQLSKLTTEDQYHAAEARIDDLIDATDAASVDILDALFKLVTEYEMDNGLLEHPTDLDFSQTGAWDESPYH